MVSRNERMKQVERYVSQAMNADERAQFRTRLERDTELRKMVDAEEFVLHTLQQDRDAAPGDHEQTRTRVLAVLASLGAGAAAASSAQAAPTTAASGTASSAGGASVAAGGMSLVKILLVVATSGVMLTSAWYLADRNAPSESNPASIERRVESSTDPAVQSATNQIDGAAGAVRENADPTNTEGASPPSSVKEPSIRQAAREDGRSGLTIEPTSGDAVRDTLKMKLQVTLPK